MRISGNALSLIVGLCKVLTYIQGGKTSACAQEALGHIFVKCERDVGWNATFRERFVSVYANLFMKNNVLGLNAANCIVATIQQDRLFSVGN